MPIIFLTGARGSGKTTLGTFLAKRMQLPFIDLDERLQQKAGTTIDQMVDEKGWGHFREQERRCLQDLVKEMEAGQNCIVATGGGIVLAEKNRKLLRKSGIVFWLDGTPEVLFERINSNPLPGQRPALTLLDPFQEMCKTITERAPLYRECAHYSLDASLQADKIYELIIDYLQKEKVLSNK